MKKINPFLFFLLAFTAITVLLFLFLKNNITNNINEYQQKVDEKWHELFDKSNERLRLLSNLKDDNLKKQINVNLKNRNFYKNENSLEFMKLEFDVNRIFLNLKSGDTINVKNVDELTSNMYEIDKIIAEYNEYAAQYNRYIITLPNSIFARKYNFKRKKLFNLQYGKENKDPIIKSKEIPEWERDTL